MSEYITILNLRVRLTTLLAKGEVQGEKKRKHGPFYLSFGFTYVGNQSDPVPQCIILCYETLSGRSIKP